MRMMAQEGVAGDTLDGAPLVYQSSRDGDNGGAVEKLGGSELMPGEQRDSEYEVVITVCGVDVEGWAVGRVLSPLRGVGFLSNTTTASVTVASILGMYHVQ